MSNHSFVESITGAVAMGAILLGIVAGSFLWATGNLFLRVIVVVLAIVFVGIIAIHYGKKEWQDHLESRSKARG